MKKQKIGLVLEGGGLRGVFTGGCVDFFLDKGIKFDYVVGVSAGSCNACAYVASKRGYAKSCMIQDDPKDNFYGFYQMKDSHKYIDLDKVFEEYISRYGLDYKKYFSNKTECELVVANIETGLAEYKSERKDLERAKTIGKASCSLPLITSPVELDGNLYLDGGLCDSIPVQRALDKGCDKVVVICTRRKNIVPHISDIQKPLYESFYHKYPKLLEAIFNREQTYADQNKLVDSLVKKGKCVCIRPTLPEIGRLESDQEKLMMYYYHGYTKAESYYKDILKLVKEE